MQPLAIRLGYYPLVSKLSLGLRVTRAVTFSVLFARRPCCRQRQCFLYTNSEKKWSTGCLTMVTGASGLCGLASSSSRTSELSMCCAHSSPHRGSGVACARRTCSGVGLGFGLGL